MNSVSIILATYNGEKFLQKQLDSILLQTLQPTELIVGDDGSGDSTLGILENFRQRAPFDVKIILNQPRLGYIDNFLNTARSSRSKYIAFSDQDDVWHPDKLRYCVDLLERNGALLCAHALDLIDDSDRVIGQFSQGIVREEADASKGGNPWGCYLGMSQVFLTEILNVIPSASRGMDPVNQEAMLAHDQWVTWLAQSLGRVTLTDRALAGYRQHGQNVFGRKRMRLADFVRVPNSTSRDLLLRESLDWSSRRKDVADGRVLALNAFLRDHPSTAYRDRALESVMYWQGIASHENLRSRLYQSEGFFRRLSVFYSAVARGAYSSPEFGGLGVRLRFKDLMNGVLKFPIFRP